MNHPIIDTHLHLWDPKLLRYPWLDDVPLLNKPYLLKDYREATDAFNIERMVFLQCECEPSQYLAETKWVEHLAKTQDPRIVGIVPFAPLEKGAAVQAELDALKQIPMVKGIRRLIQGQPDNFCLSPSFIQGVQTLPKYNYHFEICIKHPQLAAVLKLVKQCPGVTFILDHIGKPGIKDRLLDPWRAEIKELAAFPNVWCKMSGVTTEADLDHWTPADIQPYIDHIVTHFGFDRLIFGGDWPVVLLGATYEQWVNTLDAALQGATNTQKQKLFHDNAVTFYRLT